MGRRVFRRGLCFDSRPPPHRCLGSSIGGGALVGAWSLLVIKGKEEEEKEEEEGW